MMGMIRPFERRLKAVMVFLVSTYALFCLLYMSLERDPTTLLLLPNATWWRGQTPPYNMTLLEGENDLEWLIDTPGFEFLINNKRCDGVDSIILMIFVHSAPTHFHQRKVIRSTWGQEKNLSPDNMRVIFLLGTVNESAVQQQIEDENNLFHDIVQGNFVDSYRNLTYKHIMGLKWVTYFCRQARFVFKSDDDIFVDIIQLSSYLQQTFGRSSRVSNLIMCYVIRSPHVKRTHRSKWRVSFKEYPGLKYPTYCAGWAILMSPDVVFKLYTRSSKVPYFWVDDVHVSGTLARHVGAIHVDLNEKLSLEAIDVDKWLRSEDVIRPYLFGHPNTNSNTIIALWNRTMQYYSRPVLAVR